MELLFTRHRVSVEDDVKVLEMVSVDDYITLGMYLMALNCTIKNSLKGKKKKIANLVADLAGVLKQTWKGGESLLSVCRGRVPKLTQAGVSSAA